MGVPFQLGPLFVEGVLEEAVEADDLAALGVEAAQRVGIAAAQLLGPGRPGTAALLLFDRREQRVVAEPGVLGQPRLHVLDALGPTRELLPGAAQACELVATDAVGVDRRGGRL